MATLKRHIREITAQAIYMCDSIGVWSRDAINDSLTSLLDTAESIEAVVDLTTEVHKQLAEIDYRITKASRRWSVSRMARLDRSILRLAVYELVSGGDLSISITINESLELGRKYGSEESPQFINGILDRIAINEGLKKPVVVATVNPLEPIIAALLEPQLILKET